ncbi:MAG TPA: DcaP family trimeric outer membrane transporter, partial [Ignavibacteria bacterium]|nr:DcaP family trimeric outer membrane transporter [Ignavibacteria bacterium]
MKIYIFYILLYSFVLILSGIISGQAKDITKDTLIHKSNSSLDSLGSKDIHPQDSPESSGLIIESKNKKLSIRFYGSARVYGSYDFNGLQGGTGFSISEIPVGEEANFEKTFYMTANVTRLGLEVKKKTIVGNTLIKVETDFNGTDNKFRIRHAYGQTSHFIIGQTWTNFSDIETLPLTVDVDGPPTAVTVRNVLIKYYLDFKPGWRFRASIESPSATIFVPDTVSIEEVTQNYPAVSSNIKKDWKAVQIKAAGILNPISVRNISGDRGSLLGRGVLLSFNTNVSEESSIKFQGIYG